MRADSYGPAVHHHEDGCGHRAGEAAPVLTAGDGPRGDADDPWGGGGPPDCGVPCPGRFVTRGATADHAGVFWDRVVVT